MYRRPTPPTDPRAHLARISRASRARLARVSRVSRAYLARISQVRVVSVLPNRILGVTAEHNGQPIECMALGDTVALGGRQALASAAHDGVIRLWDVDGVGARGGSASTHDDDDSGDSDDDDEKGAGSDDDDGVREPAPRKRPKLKPAQKQRGAIAMSADFFHDM